MKLSWEIVRDVLIALENANVPQARVKFTDFPQYEAQNVGYHLELLQEEGLVVLEGGKVQHSTGNTPGIVIATVQRMTLDGHKLLGTLRNDTVWGKVKERFRIAGAEMTLTAVGKVAESVTASLLGLP